MAGFYAVKIAPDDTFAILYMKKYVYQVPFILSCHEGYAMPWQNSFLNRFIGGKDAPLSRLNRTVYKYSVCSALRRFTAIIMSIVLAITFSQFKVSYGKKNTPDK